MLDTKKAVVIIIFLSFIITFILLKPNVNGPKEHEIGNNNYISKIFVKTSSTEELINKYKLDDYTISNIAASSKQNTTKDDIKSFIITVAGDCTIGWDTNFGYGNRFDKVFLDNNSDYSYFFRNVKNIFDNDDITYVNLEGTFTNYNVKTPKKFNFKATPDFVNVLKEGSIELVGIANNHTYDYGQTGYNETIETLKNNSIDYFGYDNYLIKEINGIKVGFFGLIDIDAVKYKTVDQAIKYLKEQGCEIIICAIHWGIEKDYVQTQNQINLGHYMIDNGVDLVIGTHPHVIQGIEMYKDRYIIYSLANFVFGGNPNPLDKDTFIFQQMFTFKNGELLLDHNINIIPASISSIKKNNNYQPTPLQGKEAIKVFEKIFKYSINI